MENKEWREEIRCNSNGCNCTKEERATNNGNCKHSLIVSMEDKSWLKTFSGELRKEIESLVKAVLKSKQEEIEKVKFIISDGDIKREVVGLEDLTSTLTSSLNKKLTVK